MQLMQVLTFSGGLRDSEMGTVVNEHMNFSFNVHLFQCTLP